MNESLEQLTAAETVARIEAGSVRASEIAKACLSVVEARDLQIEAWQYLDGDYVMESALRVDKAHELGKPTGPLAGVLVGVKDIIDTQDMPTENGTPIDAGRKPRHDAACVSALRAAGAVIMGKTVTTELASYHPGKTRNPHNHAHTPGGSSSGSAAAVAAEMCHVALGTQTNGSVIRPASYCGVYGFKPSFGAISRRGCLEQSSPLDTIGVFARFIGDIAIVSEAISGYDDADTAMRPAPRARMRDVALSEPPLEPRFAFVKTPAWDEFIEPETAEAFEELAEALGGLCETVELPGLFSHVVGWHRHIMHADIAKNYGPLLDAAPDKISAKLASIIEDGRKVTAVNYNLARGFQEVARDAMDPLWEKFNAIITPASTGPAPAGIDFTGNPIFCTLWTYSGVPAISLPLLEINGLPVGVQLVGAYGDDARLLRTANWLVKHLAEEAGGASARQTAA
jgi:Asp-tRNA(Asn)/Glu-tRNA(Gln) amidotransferase A subunit family amidase